LDNTDPLILTCAGTAYSSQGSSLLLCRGSTALLMWSVERDARAGSPVEETLQVKAGKLVVTATTHEASES
jgi:hypothetical protein